MDNFKQYLPSKKFVAIVLVAVIFVTFFSTFKGLFSLLGSKKTALNDKNTQTPMTVSAIAQKDSNNNGIADWEEYLWGLNPNTNGKGNKDFIEVKKKALIASGDIVIPDDSKAISENELLSRQFFATIMSLQESGQLDEASINEVNNAIGSKIVAIPIPDKYTKSNLTIKTDSAQANTTYFDAFNTLIAKYENEDIGNELTLISQGLGNNDPNALYATKSIATAYKSFGAELVKIPVPSSLADTHLALANDYEKVGLSIEGLIKVLADPIIGMRSLLNYKQYSDEMISNIEKLSTALQ